MALPVLDGNQSATTLSSVVTGGEHIVAHSVVCLGSTAIANITSAVSGSVVSVSNFPSTQTIAGTVTANAGGDLASAIEIVGDVSNVSHKIAVQLYDDNGSAIGISSNPLPISGTVTANVSAQFQDAETSLYAIRSAIAYDDDGDLKEVSNSLPLPVTIQSGSVTIGSLPAISGTVTVSNAVELANALIDQTALYGSLDVNIGGTSITQPISGTVTVGNAIQIQSGNISIEEVFGENSFVPISGTVTANLVGWSGDNFENLRIGGFSVGAGDATRLALEVVGVDGNPVSVLGTVTVGALPSGSLTTRFGSVVTANLATITSAVTNTSRKYLLAQNISAGTVTIGIGFSPTTTQGIQLPAGGGLTFDAFCPTGAVYWLGAVTGAAFTILEG